MVMRISGQRFRRDPVVYWLYWVALIACRASVTVGTKPLRVRLSGQSDIPVDKPPMPSQRVASDRSRRRWLMPL